MAEAVEGQPCAAAGVCRVRVREVHNQTRVSREEFRTLLGRLTQQMDATGRPHGLRFSIDRDSPADFDLVGSAYLLSADDKQTWELYLMLAPIDGRWTLWRADEPLRLPRR